MGRLLFGLLLFSTNAWPLEIPEMRDPVCQFSKVKAHTDPKELVTEFLSKDFSGSFLKTEKWLDTAELCPGSEPAPDSSIIVKSFSIKSGEAEGDVVEYEIEYEVLGRFEPGTDGGKPVFVFNPASSVESRMVSVIKSPFGWRLRGMLMANGQHISPQAALAHVDNNFKDRKFKPEDRAQLEKLLIK